jgi:hypothetical protein
MDEPTFTDLLSQDFRWPKIGDKLFARSQPAYEAFLARHAGERLYHLTAGYKLAADLLVEQTEAEAWRRRKLVYPIVFCYRHFLELTLKGILEEYGSMGNVSPNWSHHKLEDLWRDFRTILRSLDSDHPEEGGTDAVEQCIAEFAKIDPFSETFRYPMSRKGDPFDVGCEAVDLLQLRDTMHAIENYFMGTDGFLGSVKDAQPAW